MGVSPAEPPLKKPLESWEGRDKLSPSGTAELVKTQDHGGPRTAYPVNTLPVTVANETLYPKWVERGSNKLSFIWEKTRNDLNAHQ